MSFDNKWNYKNDEEWKDSKCTNGKRQSPINIDTSNLSSCNMLCNIAMKYSASKCHVMVKNNTPIINFDNGSFIKYINRRKILQLRSMTIHVPSMHSVNGNKFDMEVILYHKFAGNLFTDSKNHVPGGTAISIMFQKGNDYGKHNAFFNSFINKIPANNTLKEIDVKVGKKWGPELIIPKKKSFYFYSGSLPFPPCNESWEYIVFDEIQDISSNIIETLKLSFNDNIRTISPLNGRVVSYNSKSEIPTDNEIEKRAAEEIKRNQKIPRNVDIESEVKQNQTMIDKSKGATAAYFKKNKKYFKNILLAIIMLLIIFTSLKIVKYIVREDLLNKIMVKQALGLSKEEGKYKNKNNNNQSNQQGNQQGNQQDMTNAGAGPANVGVEGAGPANVGPANVGAEGAGPANANASPNGV